MTATPKLIVSAPAKSIEVNRHIAVDVHPLVITYIK